jgi:hypothetical protein
MKVKRLAQFKRKQEIKTLNNWNIKRETIVEVKIEKLLNNFLEKV